jgi:hypothetical protein
MIAGARSSGVVLVPRGTDPGVAAVTGVHHAVRFRASDSVFIPHLAMPGPTAAPNYRGVCRQSLPEEVGRPHKR